MIRHITITSPVDSAVKGYKIVGRPSSRSLEVGEFDFSFSAKPYVKVSANGEGGNVSANALLPVAKD